MGENNIGLQLGTLSCFFLHSFTDYFKILLQYNTEGFPFHTGNASNTLQHTLQQYVQRVATCSCPRFQILHYINRREIYKTGI